MPGRRHRRLRLHFAVYLFGHRCFSRNAHISIPLSSRSFCTRNKVPLCMILRPALLIQLFRPNESKADVPYRPQIMYHIILPSISVHNCGKGRPRTSFLREGAAVRGRQMILTCTARLMGSADPWQLIMTPGYEIVAFCADH